VQRKDLSSLNRHWPDKSGGKGNNHHYTGLDLSSGLQEFKAPSAQYWERGGGKSLWKRFIRVVSDEK